jgi:hypothetical protein
MTKQRLSVSLDADLVDSAQRSVARGRALTLSAWVSDAVRLKIAQDRRLEALASFVAEHEREHGVITDEEVRAAVRRARSRAVTSRALGTSPTKAAKAGKAGQRGPASRRKR